MLTESDARRLVSRRQFVRGSLLVGAGGAGGAAAVGLALAAGSEDDSDSASPGAGTNSSTGAPADGVSEVAGLTGWSIPRDWGHNWRAALRRAHTGEGTAVCAVVGDSVSYGYWSSDLLTKSWPGLVRSRLVDLAGNGGSGFAGQVHSLPVMYNPDSGVPDHYKSRPGNVWGQAGDWTPGKYIQGPGAGTLTSTYVAAKLTGTFEGSELGVWYLDGGGAFDVAVDGQPVGSVRPGRSFSPANRRFAVTGGKFASRHTWSITVTKLSESGEGPYIGGVEGRAKSGVRVDNFSFPGLYSNIWSNADSWHSGTYVGGWRNPADLLIFELGGDDTIGQDPAYPSGTPARVWAQHVQTYLEGVVNTTFGGDARGDTDLIFLWPIANLAADKFILFSEYKTYALGIAQAYGAALIDISAMYRGSWNAWKRKGFAGNQSDPAGTGADPLHPSDGGTAYIADQVLRIVGVMS